jgi:hypothetical protein
MKQALHFTLVCDGSSDRVLVCVIEWLLTEKLENIPFKVVMAQGLPPPRDGLRKRVHFAKKMFPCDALIVHRDAETEPWVSRIEEITHALESVKLSEWLPLVPVRMTEAWLLCDVQAIRRASGNPHGCVDLRLPTKTKWESETDPKTTLFDALRMSSELNGRRLAKFNVHESRLRVAQLITDFGYLRGLASFDAFEKELDTVLRRLISPP